MKQQTKEFFLVTSLPLILIYWIAFITVTIIGVQESNYPYKNCYEPKKRWEYLMPAYRLGCWLGEEVEE